MKKFFDNAKNMDGTDVETDVACNTKDTATSKARGYFLTINNFSQKDENFLKLDDYQYLIYQVEKGKEGTEHIQAFIYYKNPRVWPKKKYPTAHIEKAKSFQASIKYCSKEDTRVRGPYEFGEKPEQGRRTDLEDLAKKIIDGASIEQVARESPEQFIRYSRGLTALKTVIQANRTTKPTVIWLWGLSGVGKTKYVHDRHTDIYIKDGTQWWDGYEQNEAILVDDFDGRWPFKDFLRFLDRYSYQGQYKGGYVKITSPYIYITCDKPPEEIFIREDDDNHVNQVLRRIDEIIEIKRTVKINKMPKRTTILSCE